MVKFYDTNVVINNYNNLDKENFIISSVTLEELESIKTSRNKDEETKHNARKALHWLNDNLGKWRFVVYSNKYDELITNEGLELSPDNKIIACAKAMAEDEEVVFVTEDLACKLIANVQFGLNVETIDADNSIYKGYKKFIGNTELINLYFENINPSDWNINEYLLIQNMDDGSEKEMRWDGERFVGLKLPPSKYIKGKNALQRCALDMLANPEITICVVAGGFGTGKSLLTTKMSLWNVLEKGSQSEIHLVRNPIGEGESVGWLKGDFDDKTEQFFLPFVQQLDGGEFEMESLRQRGVIEAHIPYYCKGLTFNNSIIVVDEAEDLNDKEIKLIGTRIGNSSRIFMNGDYRQAVTVANHNNALVKMCNKFKGNEMFACIYLETDVRSETSRIFAELMD